MRVNAAARRLEDRRSEIEDRGAGAALRTRTDPLEVASPLRGEVGRASRLPDWGTIAGGTPALHGRGQGSEIGDKAALRPRTEDGWRRREEEKAETGRRS